jgi:Spy/CpxP family protein refolding chaperone
MRRLGMAVALLGMLAAATPVSAGWVIDQVMKGGGADDKHRQRLFLQGNRLKTVVMDGANVTNAVVMDLDAQTITQIDYKDRAYTTATATEYAALMRQGFEKMGESMGQMQSQLKEMEEQLKNLPPEQRRQIEAMMKQAQGAQRPAAQAPLKPEDCAPDKVDVKRTGKTITVAGYDASGYQVFANGKLDSEVWIAPAITAAREIDPQKLERMMKEMMKALPQCPPRGQMFGADPMWKLMKDGYPVRSVDKDGGSVIEVVKAESRSLGAAEFQAPTGFARKTLKEMMGGK